MNNSRTLTLTCCFLTAALAVAQTPPPAAPVPPVAPMAPMEPMAPMPMPAPRPAPVVRLEGLTVDLQDLGFQDQMREQAERAREQADSVREQADRAREQADLAREQVNAARDKMRDQFGDFQFDFDFKAPLAMAQDQLSALKFDIKSGINTSIALAPFQQFSGGVQGRNFGRNDDGLYSRGQSALDNHRYDQALDAFTEVAARGGSRADGALYWKAYTLNKLGRRDDALAALAELRKTYASSRWLESAGALEIEVKQAAGQKVSPDTENSDELKLLALNGLAQSDPERAYPYLEKMVKGAQSPYLRKQALFALAENSSPKAQQLLEQIARGQAGNPDLQLQAISYLSSRNGKRGAQTTPGAHDQLLFEIYSSSSDANVKRAVLNGLENARDKDHLLQIAKSEKSADLKTDAIRRLSSMNAQVEIWQLYQSETDPEVKQQILQNLSGSGSSERLIEVARTEKDAKLRRIAIQDLGNVRAANTNEALVSIYAAEQDPQVKRSIINALSNQRNAKGLVDLGRKEHDMDLKKEIVRRLVDMHSPEATQFLEEILK